MALIVDHLKENQAQEAMETVMEVPLVVLLVELAIMTWQPRLLFVVVDHLKALQVQPQVAVVQVVEAAVVNHAITTCRPKKLFALLEA